MVRISRVIVFCLSAVLSLWTIANPIPIKSLESIDSISTHFYYLEDPESNLSLETLRSSQGLPWRKITDSTINFGYSTSSFWLKARVLGTQPCEKMVLKIGYPLLDEVDFHFIANKAIIHKYQTGDARPFEQRPIDFRSFVFPFECKHINGEIYLRVKSSSSLLIPLEIKTYSELWASEQNILLSQGLYFGILLVLILYNLFIYLTIKEKTFLYYVGYVAVYALVQGSLHGFNFQYLWPNAVFWNQISVACAVSATVFFGCIFAVEFLQLKKHFNRYAQLLVATAYLGAGNILFSLFLPYQIAIYIGMFLTILGTAFITYCGLLVWVQKKSYAAGYFTMAWLTFLVGSNVMSLVRLGIAPSNFITENSAQIGSALEVILLSIAMSDRIRLLTRRQQRSQQLVRRTLENQNIQLQALSSLKDKFLSLVSREIKNPLKAIETQLAQLNYMNQPELKSIHTATQEMDSYIDKLLIYSEIQNGLLKIELESIKLFDYCEELASSAKVRCQDKNLHFSFTYSNSLPAEIKSDPKLLHLVVFNLLENAIKFTRYGEIRFSAKPVLEQNKEFIELKIADTGSGFAYSEYKKQRLEKTLENNDIQSGLGIGLSLCEHLVRQLQGNLLVSSQLNQGSEVTVILPVQAENIMLAMEQKVNQFVDKMALLIDGSLQSRSNFLTLLQKLKLDTTVNDDIKYLRTDLENEYDVVFINTETTDPVYIEKILNQRFKHRIPPIFAITSDQTELPSGLNAFICETIPMSLPIQELSERLRKWL